MSELMTARIVRPEQSDDCMHTVIRWSAENELLESFSMANAFRFCFQSFTLLQFCGLHTFWSLSQNEPANQSTQAKNHRFTGFSKPINCHSAPNYQSNELPNELSRLKEWVGPRGCRSWCIVYILCLKAWSTLFQTLAPCRKPRRSSRCSPGISGVFLLGGWIAFIFFGPRLKIIYEACIYCSLAVCIIHTWHILCIKEVLEDDRYYPTVYVVMISVHSSESSGCGSARRYTSKPFCARPGAGGWWESAWDSSLNMLVL